MINQFLPSFFNKITNNPLLVSNSSLTNFLQPLMLVLITTAGLIASFFIIISGLEYMTSRGNVQRLEHAKKTFKNALLGLILVIAASFLVNFLNTAYNTSSIQQSQDILPSTVELVEISEDESLASKILITSTDFLRKILTSAFQPFVDLIQYLSLKTPLIGSQPVTVKLWLVVLGISNSLLVLMIALLGFKLMSATTFGFEEISFKKLLPKIGLCFLLMNASLFVIDVLISLSNAMLDSLWVATDVGNLWQTWQIMGQSSSQAGFVSLLLMIVFLILSFLLLIYYLLRLVIIYLGAVLSPLVALMQLLPLTQSLTKPAIKTYFFTIFILFIHGLILALASGLLISFNAAEINHQGLLTLVLGIATLTLLLKIPKTIAKWCQVNYSYKSLKQIGHQLTTVLSSSTNKNPNSIHNLKH